MVVLFFCRYAWFNPDGECYAHLEGRHVSDINDGDSIDVAELFHHWFVDFTLLLILVPILGVYIYCTLSYRMGVP